jgi:aminoglycoside phosphotransferase family enzyme/predicted kinase
MATASDAPDAAGRNGVSRALVSRLLTAAAYPHPVGPIRLVETHISWVFLTGEYVYKVKKPVDLGFLDFSTLDRRRHSCAEEVRLNRRFAPDLYLDAVPITGAAATATVGGTGDPVEWAVRLRQFDEDARLDRLLDRGGLDGPGCAELAAELARVQERLEVADPGSPWGTPAAVATAIDDTLRHLRRHRADALDRIDAVGRRMHERLDGCRTAIEDRRHAGRVRQCHGDLHLANLVRHEGRFLAFDAIEFSDTLRWIDVASDLAFLAMDLESRGRPDLAAAVTSGWIEASGDHDAVRVLPLYKTYRAVVRAAVAAIRGAQAAGQVGGDASRSAKEAAAECDRYLALAEQLVADRRPVMVATCGVSGSGKTTLAAAVAAALGGIRLRSDVERKRAVGMAPTERPADAAATAALYCDAATERTYARLADLARLSLDAGTSVVVDAACNRRAERRVLAAAAAAAGAPLVWLALDVSETEVVARVARRQADGKDASDATTDVVRRQFATREPLEQAECGGAAGDAGPERVLRVSAPEQADPENVTRRVRMISEELAG